MFASRFVARGDDVATRDVARVHGCIIDIDDVASEGTWSRQLIRTLARDAREVRRGRGHKKTKAYVESLPRERRACGLAYDERAVRALMHTWDDVKARDDVVMFERQTQRAFAEERANDQELTEEEWRWATAMVHSRTFRLEDEYGRRPTRRALIPDMDMFNHSSSEANCEWKSNGETFVVSATRDVKSGEELFLSYGNQCDGHFMLFYGFLPEPNPNNRVRLFDNGAHALDWYQALCGVARDDGAWENEKKRVNRAFENKFCVYRPDGSGLLRRVGLEGLFLGDKGVVDESLIWILTEIAGVEDVAIAAIRARALEVIDTMERTNALIERAFVENNVSSQNIALMREFRRRKANLLRQVV